MALPSGVKIGTRSTPVTTAITEAQLALIPSPSFPFLATIPMGNTFPPEYRPNESSADIFAEHTWLQGAFLAAVAYGIQFVLYVMACFFLWKLKSRLNAKKNMFFISYISIIFILSTLYMAGLFQFTQLAFIDGRNIPGGPNAFENVMFSLPIDMLANVIMVMNSWFCDIINVWRCFVIYQGCRINSWTINTIPILLYLGSVAFGILFLKQVGTVSQSPWESSGINFTIPYYTMSLALNILVTLLIVMRLLLYRYRINKAMGSGHGSQYTSLAAMIVESAAIYSSFALLFLVPFAVNSPLAQLFLQALSPIQGLSTFLIIFRIATGKGWSHDAYVSAMNTSTTARTMPKFRVPKPTPPTTVMMSSHQIDTSHTTREGDISLRKIPSGTDASSTRDIAAKIEISRHILIEETV